jgi:hypothetical protein
LELELRSASLFALATMASGMVSVLSLVLAMAPLSADQVAMVLETGLELRSELALVLPLELAFALAARASASPSGTALETASVLVLGSLLVSALAKA